MENIIQSISVCANYIKTLDGSISGKNEVTEWFKSLCLHLEQMIASVLDWYQTNGKVEDILRDSLILYLRQLVTFLSLLISLFAAEAGSSEILTETRLYGKHQIIWCLNGIQGALDSNKPLQNFSGSFIKWMDLVLNKIEDIDMTKNDKELNIKISNEAKLIIEEVLSHAMSIAQLSLLEDCHIIKGACQSILESFDCLIKEIHNSNLNMVNLYIDICSNKLCSLEAKVNTAMLKLSIDVFSNYTLSLDKIKTFCFLDSNKNCMDTLDSLVADFDLQVDRIMQIGLFAVSCSTCSDRCIKIKNCLASLEALESELVPALTAALLDKTAHNINHAQLLTNHWLHQAAMLKNYIFLIIDPLAFSKVFFEEIQLNILDINEDVKKNGGNRVKQLVSTVAHKCQVLQDFLKAVLPDIENEFVGVKSTYTDLRNILHEVNYAPSVLLEREVGITRDDLKRMTKRCKILLSIIKKLLRCFAGDNLQTEPIVKTAIPPENPFLDHIIERGKQILKDRSILYKSVNENEDFNSRQAIIKKISSLKGNKSIPLSKLVHLRKLSFVNTKIKNDSTVELQITDILKELTNLSSNSIR